MSTFEWVALSDTAQGPTKAHWDDAGFDLYVDEHDWMIQPGQFVDIPLGIAAKLPPGTWGLLTGRSSTLRRMGLMVAQGVIDSGYTGPLFAGVWNLTDRAITVAFGSRIAQYIVMTNAGLYLDPVQVEELPQTERGQKGFGSSGN